MIPNKQVHFLLWDAVKQLKMEKDGGSVAQPSTVGRHHFIMDYCDYHYYHVSLSWSALLLRKYTTVTTELADSLSVGKK